MSRSSRLLLALPGAFSRHGGLEAFNRLLIKAADAHAGARGGRVVVLSLNDAPGSSDARYLNPDVTEHRGYDRDKRAFARDFATTLAALRPHGLLVGHVNLAPLALAARPLLTTWQWCFIHGIEAWVHLPAHKRAMLALADRVFAVSRHTLTETARLNRLSTAHMDVFHNALDPVWVAQRDAGDTDERAKHTILTVTRLTDISRGKGVDIVLLALPQVLAAIPTAHYDIVGDGPDRPRLQAIANELGLGDAVTFHGRVSDEALEQHYRSATVFCMPSMNEGFGIVFLEAGHYGMPSVAGDYAGAKEAVVEGKTGFRVLQDPDVIADRLLRLLSDPALAHQIGAQARAHVAERYRFDSFARRFEQAITAPRRLGAARAIRAASR